jgi:hypothetical protein
LRALWASAADGFTGSDPHTLRLLISEARYDGEPAIAGLARQAFEDLYRP